jgi:hypothetical protein
MNESDFKILTENGSIGFYQSCEITQFFVQEKESKSVINFFILASFEDNPFINRNHSFLTSKKGIKINDSFNLGIQRYYLSMDEARETFNCTSPLNNWTVLNKQFSRLNLRSTHEKKRIQFPTKIKDFAGSRIRGHASYLP